MEIPEFARDLIPWFIAAGALALVLVVISVRRQPSKVFAFETDSGRVEIARSAIVELVQTSCDQIAGMKRPRIRLKTGRSGLSLTVAVKITENCRLQDYAKLLQNHLQTTLSDNLGIQKLQRVNILVTSFRSGNVPALKTAKLTDVTAEPPKPPKDKPTPLAGKNPQDHDDDLFRDPPPPNQNPEDPDENTAAKATK